MLSTQWFKYTIYIPFQNFTWCCMLLGILVITLGGLISSRRLSTLSTLFPQYHLCPLCLELNHRPTSCFTTPRNTQCIASIPMPLTMSKLGNFNKGLGALKPQTWKINLNFRISLMRHIKIKANFRIFGSFQCCLEK